MRKNNEFLEKKINKVTIAKHNKQFWMQIMIPIIGFIILITLSWVILGLTNTGSYSSWSSLSIIFLSIFILLISLLTLVALIFVTIGLGKLLNFLPEKTFIAQNWLLNLKNKIEDISDRIVSPLITSKSWVLTLNVKNLFKKDGENNE